MTSPGFWQASVGVIDNGNFPAGTWYEERVLEDPRRPGGPPHSVKLSVYVGAEEAVQRNLVAGGEAGG